MNRFERHPRLTITAVAGALVLLFLVALECLLRFTQLQAILVNDPWSFAALRHLELREYPPSTVFRFSAPDIRRSSGDRVADVYTLQTDGDGFIQPGRNHSDPDITIVFLGGSTTECLYVDPEARFPALVGRALEERLGLKVNVINAARSGSNTQHMQLVLQGKILPLRPDIVVLMENANDLGILNRFGTYWNNDPTYRLLGQQPRDIVTGLRFVRDGLLGHSYRLIRHSFSQLSALAGMSSAQARTSDGQAATEDWARQYEASLTQFAYTVKAWGARPVLMTQVIQDNSSRQRKEGEGNYLADALLARRGFSASSFDTTHGYFNEIARYVSARHDAGLVDLSGAGGWDGTMLYDGLHFSDPGSRRAAAIIEPVLSEEIQRIRQDRQK